MHSGHQGKADHFSQESRQDERHASLFTSRHRLADFTGRAAYLFEEVRDRSANLSFENIEPKRPVLIVLTFARAQDKAELCVQRAVQRGMVVGVLVS